MFVLFFASLCFVLTTYVTFVPGVGALAYVGGAGSGGVREIPRACSTPGTNKYPFCNTALPVESRIKNLISLLNLAEKPLLLTARESPGGAVPRIGLPAYDWGANCVHGVQSKCGTRCPTSFPTPCALGASFNMSLVKDMASVIGIELRSLWLQGVTEASGHPVIGLDCWSPNININRDPRWGRNMEVPGEDPYLTGQYGLAYTRGIQEGEDKRYLQAVVTLKHWAAYSVENYKGVTRFAFNAVVTPYDLTNTYFPAWKTSVVEGNAKGVMCSYNALNGIPACSSQFLNNTLRGTYAFSGYVTSDTGAVACQVSDHHYVKTLAEAASVSIKAGTDINSGGVYLDHLIDALNEGLIKESDIDNALYNSLKMRFELGLFDPIDDQPYWHIPPDAVNTPASQDLNLLATRQSIVLLQNNRKTLPFPKGSKIAVVGPHGNSQLDLVGNYIGEICPEGGYTCITSPFTAISKSNVGGSTVYFEGCTVSGTNTSGFDAAVEAAKEADYVVLILGINQSIEREALDRVEIDLPGVQELFATTILKLGKPTALVLINGGIIAIDNLKPITPAIIEAFYPGYWGGVAIADVIFGDYNPGGKLPVTYYDNNYINKVDFLNMNMTDAPGRGYRYYTGTPLWPFGWGLSYTTFQLSLLETVPVVMDNTDEVSIDYHVNVTNTGPIAGDEVVLAYYKPGQHEVPLIKQLFGFQRVHLLPNESVQLTFTVNAQTLAVGSTNGDLLSVPGSYRIEFTNGVDQNVIASLDLDGKQRLLEKYPF